MTYRTGQIVELHAPAHRTVRSDRFAIVWVEPLNRATDGTPDSDTA
jgi:hypothetical protein